MFGIGIFELLVILVVAVIALGPDKLPQTIVDIVKFFRAVRKTMAEAKESFDKEIQLSEIKQEALKYKNTLTEEIDKLTKDMQLDELRQISADALKPLEETNKAINEETNTLQDTLQTLNAEISYTTPQNPAEVAKDSQNIATSPSPQNLTSSPHSTLVSNNADKDHSATQTTPPHTSHKGT